MAVDTKFITEANFTSYADISTYLATKYLYPSILVAQEKFIRPIVGNTLYAELQTQVAATSVTAANQLLLNEIYPVLVYYSYGEYLLVEGVYDTNMGLREYKEEHSDPASAARVGAIRRNVIEIADMYERQLRAFLADNSDNYPDYTAGDGTTYRIPFFSKVAKKNENPARTDFN